MLVKRRAFQIKVNSSGKDRDLDFFVCSYFNGLYPVLLLFSKEGGVLLSMGQEQGDLLAYSLGHGDSFSWCRISLGFSHYFMTSVLEMP